MQQYQRFILPLFFVLSTVSLYLYANSEIALISYQSGKLQIADFANYMIIFRAFWFEGLSSPYANDAAVFALERYVRGPVNASMPTAVSPVFVVLSFPLAVVAGYNLLLAFALWGGAALSAFLWASGLFLTATRRASPLGLGLVAVTMLSFAFVYSLLTGQTAIIAASLLAVLVLLPERESWWLRGIILFVLMIKLPYGVLGVLCLFARRQWSALALGTALSLVSLVIFHLWAGRGWFSDFLYTFSLYSASEIPEHYRAALPFDRMNIARTVLREFFSLRASIVFSNSALLLFLAAASVAAAVKRTEFALLVGISGWLLFSPYLGIYEDLFLFSALVVVIWKVRTPLNSFKVVALALLLFASLNQALLVSVMGRPLCFSCKFTFLVACFMLVRWGTLRSPSTPRE